MGDVGLHQLDQVGEQQHHPRSGLEPRVGLIEEALEQPRLEVERQVEGAIHLALHPGRVERHQVGRGAPVAEQVTVDQLEGRRRRQSSQLTPDRLDGVGVVVGGDHALEAGLTQHQRDHTTAGAHIHPATTRALILAQPRGEQLEMCHARGHVGAVEGVYGVAEHRQVGALTVPLVGVVQVEHIGEGQREARQLGVEVEQEAHAR